MGLPQAETSPWCQARGGGRVLRPRPAVRRCHSGSGHSAPDHPVYSPSPALCPGSRRLRGTQKTGSLSLGASRPPGGAWHTGESAACGDIQAGPALGTRGQPAHVPVQRHPLITQRPETKAIPGQRFGARSLRMAHLCFALIVLHERARQQLSTHLGLKRAACRLEREKETESRDAERWRQTNPKSIIRSLEHYERISQGWGRALRNAQSPPQLRLQCYMAVLLLKSPLPPLTVRLIPDLSR